jgi:hypothetical protein
MAVLDMKWETQATSEPEKQGSDLTSHGRSASMARTPRRIPRGDDRSSGRPKAQAGQFTSADRVVLRDDEVSIGLKVFRSVRMTPIKEPGKEVPRVMPVGTDCRRTKARRKPAKRTRRRARRRIKVLRRFKPKAIGIRPGGPVTFQSFVTKALDDFETWERAHRGVSWMDPPCELAHNEERRRLLRILGPQIVRP